MRVGLLQEILANRLGELLMDRPECLLEGLQLLWAERDDLAAALLDSLDVAGFPSRRILPLEGGQLPRRVAHDLLEVRRKPVVHLLAEEEGVPQEAVVGQHGVLLDLVELHVDDGDQGVFLRVHHALLQRVVRLGEVDGNRVRLDLLVLRDEQRALHHADLHSGEILGLPDRLVRRDLLESALPEGDAL